jgi:hypothetical protein
MRPVIYMRSSAETEEERAAAEKAGFRVISSRCDVEEGDLVIPRYAALPFHRELEVDVEKMGGRLINTTAEHNLVADIVNVAYTLHGMTPPAFLTWENLRGGPYVMKGRTNSRKHQWATRMFAPTWKDLAPLAAALLDDPMLAEQGLVVRPYVPLRTFDIGLNGLPITNEWRVFFLNGDPVDGSFYWSTHPELEWIGADPGEREREPNRPAPIPEAAYFLAKKAAEKLSVPFVAIDVAQTEKGDWIVIEANDGTMSGISMIPPERFYNNFVGVLLCQEVAANDRKPFSDVKLNFRVEELYDGEEIKKDG